MRDMFLNVIENYLKMVIKKAIIGKYILKMCIKTVRNGGRKMEALLK